MIIYGWLCNKQIQPGEFCRLLRLLALRSQSARAARSAAGRFGCQQQQAALKLGASVGSHGPRKVIKVVGFMGLFHGKGGMGME